MQTAKSRPGDAKPDADLILLGSVCGLLSAVGYTAANVCLRTATDSDPVWVSAVKSVPTVAIFGPYLALRAFKALPIGPSPQAFWFLVATGLLGQLGGNVAFQWSLGVIGLALAVPLCLGMMIVFGAWLGWSFLGERVTWRTIASMIVLFVAVMVVCLGATHGTGVARQGDLGQPARRARGCRGGVRGRALLMPRSASRFATPLATAHPRPAASSSSASLA